VDKFVSLFTISKLTRKATDVLLNLIPMDPEGPVNKPKSPSPSPTKMTAETEEACLFYSPLLPESLKWLALS